MKSRYPYCAVVFVCLCLPLDVWADKRKTTITWADSHPEVVKLFGRPFSSGGMALRRKFPVWPVEEFSPQIVASQPTVVLGKGQLLIAHSWSGIARSSDGGRTWKNIGVPRPARIPAGHKVLANTLDGCGVTSKGTLLAQFAVQHNDGRKYEGLSDPTYHADLYVLRSSDGGKTWDQPIRLNAAPRENSGGHRTRFARLAGGVMALSMGAWYQGKSGKPLPLAERFSRTILWRSHDDGRTWQRNKTPICLHGAEPDLLQLPSGRILAAVRYQRHKLPSDPPALASPHLMRGAAKPPFAKAKQVGRGLVFRNTALLHSDDAGKTWSRPRLVTGFDEQTGCLVRLSSGAIILVFGHKTDGTGQRFMVSYDSGKTWSRRIYQLGRNGLYGSSVVLKDDTIVTVFHRIIEGVGIFRALRWKPPSRKIVSQGGFWKPKFVE